jgi:hypothetical protein
MGEQKIHFNSLIYPEFLAVHPHVCGEYVAPVVQFAIAKRFIPTCHAPNEGSDESKSFTLSMFGVFQSTLPADLRCRAFVHRPYLTDFTGT